MDCTVPANSRKTGSMCHTHAVTVLRGQVIGETRPKRRSHEPVQKCLEQRCGEAAVSLGRCRKHYESYRSPRKSSPCLHDGCPVDTVLDYCAYHLQQFDSWGITWEAGSRPNAQLTEIRNSRCGKCVIPSCPERASSQSAVFCKKHRADRARKHCSADFYIGLMSIESCQICGSPQRLVVDHRHGHHPDKSDDWMCEECIRGRLCSDCNTAIGLLRESTERAELLVAYMEGF